MGIIESIATMKDLAQQSQAVAAQLQPLQQQFMQQAQIFQSLDRTQAYFITNPDGSIIVIQFLGPQQIPAFVDAVPYPVPVEASPANILALVTAAQGAPAAPAVPPIPAVDAPAFEPDPALVPPEAVSAPPASDPAPPST